MHLCYLDESGVIERGAGTTHFVLLGLAIPAETWKAKDAEISALKRRHRLGTAEIHTGWMLRRYSEQERIENFNEMSERSDEPLRFANAPSHSMQPQPVEEKLLKSSARITRRPSTTFISRSRNAASCCVT